MSKWYAFLMLIGTIIVLPYYSFYEWTTRKGSNSGHTAGLAQGFMDLAAVACFLIQIVVGVVIYVAIKFS